MVTLEEQINIQYDEVRSMLHELQFRVHRNGYKQLIILIPRYALDNTQSITKELYPYVAKYFGYASWQPIEHAIRVAIVDAWKQRDVAIWDQYFPNTKKPPSNKLFIATIAELLNKSPPG